MLPSKTLTDAVKQQAQNLSRTTTCVYMNVYQWLIYNMVKCTSWGIWEDHIHTNIPNTFSSPKTFANCNMKPTYIRIYESLISLSFAGILLWMLVSYRHQLLISGTVWNKKYKSLLWRVCVSTGTDKKLGSTALQVVKISQGINPIFRKNFSENISVSQILAVAAFSDNILDEWIRELSSVSAQNWCMASCLIILHCWMQWRTVSQHQFHIQCCV